MALLDGKALPRRTAKEVLYAWCVREQRRLVDLARMDADAISAALALPLERAELIARALRDTTSAEATLARLAEMHIEVVTRVDAPYPEELAHHLPEAELPFLLFALGNLDLLAETGIAIGGARDAAEVEDGDLAQLASSLASLPLPTIGGFGRGVDRELLLRSAKAEGRIIAMLPLGLDHARPIVALAQPALDAGRALLVSPFMPDQPYTENTGLARLALISALSAGLLLVEPDLLPSDWPGATDLIGRGGVATVLAATDSAAAQAWGAIGAHLVDRPVSAIQSLTAILAGITEAATPDALPGVEPIYFEDAEQAIEVLGRSGRVPPSLARRLRESSIFGYQDADDIDADNDEDEAGPVREEKS